MGVKKKWSNGDKFRKYLLFFIDILSFFTNFAKMLQNYCEIMDYGYVYYGSHIFII